MKYFLNGILIVVLGAFISSCSSIKVISDKDPTVDFTTFKTFEYYGWAEESDKILNRFDKERIESAFNAEFNDRGMQSVESGGDVIITLFVVEEQKTKTTANTTTMGGGYGAGYGGYYGHGPGYGWGGGHSTTTYSDYDYVVGTLVIDMYDAKEKQLIWEAVGTKTIVEKTDGREQRIQQAVAAIMKEYPVPPVESN